MKTAIVVASLLSTLSQADSTIDDQIAAMNEEKSVVSASLDQSTEDHRDRDRRSVRYKRMQLEDQSELPPLIEYVDSGSSQSNNDVDSVSTQENETPVSDNPTEPSPSRNENSPIEGITQEEERMWDRLAECESSGNWSINSGNGFYGRLQFTPSSWVAAGGDQYAPSAHLATREQQIATARVLRDMQTMNAWPVCSRKIGAL